MGGIWNPSPPPIRPGFYINFETTGTEAVTTGNTGVVGLPITADWGPVGEFVLLSSDAQLQNTFGPVDLNSLSRHYLVQEAFRGGAAQVLAYRMTDGTESSATLDLYDEQVSAVAPSAAVTTVTPGGTGVNEVQKIAFSGQVEGGTFTISTTGTTAAPVTAQVTAAIPYNASATQIKTALEALALFAPGDVIVTGTAPGDITITFAGAFAATDMVALTVAAGSLTAGTNAKELVMTVAARYAGTHGNDIRVVVRRNVLDSSKTDLVVYENSNLRERYLVNNADHQTLADQINDPVSGSQLVVATVNVNHSAYGTWTDGAGHALDEVALGANLTGGTSGYSTVDGSVPLTTYISTTDGVPQGVLDAYQRQGGFDVFTLAGEADRQTGGFSLIGGIREWTRELNNSGQYVTSVIGGAANESLTAALSRSNGIDLESVVNVGASDLRVTYPNGTVKNRSSADMTARVAGMIAASGITNSITLRSVSTADSPVTLTTPLTKAEIEDAITSGLVVFTNRNGRIVVEDEVTTFTSFTTAKDRTFGSIRNVRVMQQIGRDFNNSIEETFIGQTSNSPATQSSLLSLVADYLGSLESQGAIMTGSQVALDERYDNSGENIYLLVNLQFARTLKRVLLTLRAPVLS